MNTILPLGTTARRPSVTRKCSGIVAPNVAISGANSEALSGFPQVRSLLVDPENVIYDATLWQRWLRQVLMRMNVASTFPKFFSTWDRHFRKDVDLGKRDYWEAFREFLTQAGLSEGQIAEIMASAVSRKERFERDVRCLPGVKETLASLSASGVSLYVLTNSPQAFEERAAALAAMGVPPVFCGGLTSRDLGRVMPSSKSYRTALERFGVAASEAAFVASPARLLRGAQRCGIRSVAFNPVGYSRDAISLERFSDLAHCVSAPLRAKRAG